MLEMNEEEQLVASQSPADHTPADPIPVMEVNYGERI